MAPPSGAAGAHGPWAVHAQARELLTTLGLESYAVGGWERDLLAGKTPKDLDVAVCGVSYQQLQSALRPHGLVQPNIVGGGKLGLRVYGADGQPGELLTAKKGEDFRAFFTRAVALGRPEPEVYDGSGRLVGCRFHADWTPEGGIEISLARTERSTAVGRANFDVLLDPAIAIEADLARRDFTVNAMARNLATGELVDPFGGAQDVKDKVLRVVGPESFTEDPSRMIRGLARIAKDDLTPDEYTLAQMRANAHLLAAEPVEQLYLDLDAALNGPHAAKAMRVARDTGVLEMIVPEFQEAIGFAQESQYHDLSCDEHILLVLERAVEAEASPAVRWAALLHDLGKPRSAFRGQDGHLHFHAAPAGKEIGCPACGRTLLVDKQGQLSSIDGREACPHCGSDLFGRGHEEIGAAIARQALGRLKQPPKELIAKVELLVAEHMFNDQVNLKPLKARKFIRRVGRDNVEELLALRRADHGAKNRDGLSAADDDRLTAWESLVREQMEAPLYAKELAVDGHDALAFGFTGTAIGEALETLLTMVVADPSENRRQRLLPLLARRAAKQGLLGPDEAEALLATRMGS